MSRRGTGLAWAAGTVSIFIPALKTWSPLTPRAHVSRHARVPGRRRRGRVFTLWKGNPDGLRAIALGGGRDAALRGAREWRTCPSGGPRHGTSGGTGRREAPERRHAGRRQDTARKGDVGCRGA